MAAMAREPLHVPDLPPSNNEISAVLVIWAVDGKEGHFRMAEAVTHVPLLQKHLGLSAVE
jgi:hypothetical protein